MPDAQPPKAQPSDPQPLEKVAAMPAPSDPLIAARHWLTSGRTVSLATVVETWGSAAVPVGGQLVILDDENFQGSVSGGCVEADVIVASEDVIRTGRPEVLAFGVSNETAWRSGLACGGKIKILVVALNPTEHLPHIEEVIAARAARQPVALVTDLATGAVSVVRATDALRDQAIETALASGASTLVTTDDAVRFVHAMTPPPRIVIIGATEIAQHLSQMAETCRYDVVVIDPRPAFTGQSRFDPSKVVTSWPDVVLPALLEDPFSVVVTLTHADAIDDEALAIAMRSGCRYIGALGARRTHASRRQRLQSAGFSEADLNRIHSPIGLDIGARTPGEIAVSILGEIVSTFRQPKS